MKTWVNNHWARVGGVWAICIGLVLSLTELDMLHIDKLLWLHLVVLLIHQFEEYVYPGGFKIFYNTNIYNKNKVTTHPLTDNAILLVNLGIGWTVYLFAAVKGESSIFLSIGLAGITIFNGLLHTFLALLHRSYNPGLYSSILLFIPFGSYLLYRLCTEIELNLIAIGIVIFLLGIFLVPGTIFIASQIKHKKE